MVSSTNPTTRPTWEVALKTFIADFQLGPDGIGLFALQLQFDIEDVASAAAEAMTGGGDDKKCDMLWIDDDRGIAVIAQCYQSQRPKSAAPSNKAADLGIASAWLLARPLEDLPDGLKGLASELREAITGDRINQILVWYVHNLPESANSKQELTTVSHTVKQLIEKIAPGNSIAIICEEIGAKKLSEIYDEAERTFRVTAEVEIASPHAFEVASGDWKSLVATVTGKRLY